ncbi:AI-2E family transporter [Arthrobacter castelli]|uniref:AI-2E family transporter n=1 Tax=Arthrobacter castelli TaxID=271431 RepID=UPI000400CEC9|nr:AI-2E family transporter [Arthrobacter castelli]
MKLKRKQPAGDMQRNSVEPTGAVSRSRQRPPVSSVWSDSLGRVAMRTLQILLILTLAIAAIFALIQLKLVVIPLLVALLLAAAISPLVNLLRRHNVPKVLATWIALLTSVVILGGIITGIVFAVRSQWNNLIANASRGLDQLQDFIVSGPLPISDQQLTQAREAAIDFITSTQFGNSAIAGLSVFASIVTGLLLTVVVLFFFLQDGLEIWEFFLKPLRGEQRNRAERIGHSSMVVMGGYVRGTAIIAFVDAAAIGIALAILGVPLALPLAVIVFLGAFVPIIGATIAGILAALVALVTNGPIVALIVVAVIVVIQQLEGNLLQPLIMSQTVKLHALVILLALTAGTILGGIVGAVLSVPITAVAWTIIKVWNGPPEPEPPLDKATADMIGDDRNVEA